MAAITIRSDFGAPPKFRKSSLPTLAQTVKASAYNAGDPVRSLDQEDPPGEGNGNPLQYSCLENPMDGRRSLVGYSPWGHKESDTIERLHFHFQLPH